MMHEQPEIEMLSATMAHDERLVGEITERCIANHGRPHV
jgi:hypothetical protein